MCLRNWLFFCPSFKVYLASKRNTPQKTFLRHLMELGRFQVSLARKSLKCVSHPEPEAWLGLFQPPGRVGCGMDSTEAGKGSYSGYRSWAQGATLCPTPRLGIWRMSLNSGQTLPINSFPVGPASPFFLFSDLILGEDSRQSPKHRSQTSLSSETGEWPHGSLAETLEQQHHLQPHRPQTRVQAAPLLPP